MSSVNQLVQKAVDKINENNQSMVENRVKTLVHNILDSESLIKEHQEKIKKFKEELKQLQLPEAVKLEL